MGGGARSCYAAQLGGCSGSLNLEHFVSKNLLKTFEEDGRLRVVGYPHGRNAGPPWLSVESFSAKVLCESHNGRLSELDAEGGRFLAAFFDAHTGLLNEEVHSDQTIEFDGPLVERWMLKLACGLLASGQAGIGATRMEKTTPPVEFLQVLFGMDTLPEAWGLYTRPTASSGLLVEKTLEIAPLFLSVTPKELYRIVGVKMEHYAFTTLFALTQPDESFIKSYLEDAFHHPEFFTLKSPRTGRSVTIVVNWPEPKIGHGFVIGVDKERPPFRVDLKE